MLLVVSPRCFPVPDRSAGTMDVMQVQLFAAVVSESSPPYTAKKLSQDSAPIVTSTVAGGTPMPKSRPASSSPAVKPKNPKLPSRVVSQVGETPKTESVQVTSSYRDSRAPAVSAEKPVDGFLDSIKSGIKIPEPMVPAASLPQASKLIKASDLLAVFPPPVESSETGEHVRTFVKEAKEALKEVPLPTPLEQSEPVREMPKLAKLDMSGVAGASEATEQVRHAVKEAKEALKEVPLPTPLEQSEPVREMPKLAKLDMSGVAGASEATEQVRHAVKEAKEVLKEVPLPTPLEQSEPVREMPKLAKLDMSGVAGASEATEQVRHAVKEAKEVLKEVPLPTPLEQSEPVREMPKLAKLDMSGVAGASEATEQVRHAVKEAKEALKEVPLPAPLEHPIPVDPPLTRSVANRSGDSAKLPQHESDEQRDKVIEYMGLMKSVIDRNWHWQGDNDVELRVWVSFRVNRHGHVVVRKGRKVEIEKTSGNLIFDRAAIRAVEQLKRLPPFPEAIQREFLDVRIALAKVKAS